MEAFNEIPIQPTEGKIIETSESGLEKALAVSIAEEFKKVDYALGPVNELLAEIENRSDRGMRDIVPPDTVSFFIKSETDFVQALASPDVDLETINHGLEGVIHALEAMKEVPATSAVNDSVESLGRTYTALTHMINTHNEIANGIGVVDQSTDRKMSTPVRLKLHICNELIQHKQRQVSYLQNALENYRDTGF